MIHDDETRSSVPRQDPPGYGAAPRPGAAPPPPKRDGGFTVAKALPIAVVLMAAVVAFIIVWLVTHHSTKSSPTGAAVSSGSSPATVTVTNGPSTSSSSTSATTSKGNAGAPSAAPSTVTTTATSSSSTARTNVDFPPGVVDQCADYLASGGYQAKNPSTGSIGDPGVRVSASHPHNSCDFLRSAGTAVRGQESSDGSSFSVDVPSAWRVANGYSPNVTLNCTMDGDLAHCVNHENAGVDMYVKP